MKKVLDSDDVEQTGCKREETTSVLITKTRFIVGSNNILVFLVTLQN